MIDYTKLFKEEEMLLITDVLNTGKKDSEGNKVTWSELADRYNIKPSGSNVQKTKAANDVWRRFIKIIDKHNLDLTTVKQTLNGNGDILFETKKILPKEYSFNEKDYTVDKITTNPHGGQWVSFKKKESEVTSNTIEITLERLFTKYKDFQIKDDFNFKSLWLEEDFFNIKESPKLAVLNLYDAHLDKLPIKSVCGVESTLEENIRIFHKTVDRILPDLVGVEEIIFPVGNDLFHTNGFNSQTKKGTQIEYYGSPEDSYYAICDIITETILKLSTIANVRVMMIKGNHDEDKITTLGYWLNRAFKDTNVIVDYERKQRKYYRYGENLLGFAHGDKEKSKIPQLPLIMAQEAKEDWGLTTFRKFYCGDLHHGFEYQFLKSKDMPGAEVEFLRSVGTTDSWHEDFGWIGIPKTGYLQIFDKEEGEITRKKYNIK